MKFIINIYLRRFTYGLMAGMLVGGALGGYFISLYLFKPDFRLSALELTNTNEKQFDLAEQKDKPMVLNFLSRGCMPCIQELPIFESAVNRYKDSIQFYFIMEEDKEGIQSFQKKYPYKLDYLLSKKSFTDYGILGVPQTYFIDKNFKVIDSQKGSFDSPTLMKKLNEFLRR
jgi:thiol-disulfide isomerase/thioredoxin